MNPGACFCGAHEPLAVYDFGAGGVDVLCDRCAAECGEADDFDPADFRSAEPVGIRTNELADGAVCCEACGRHVPSACASEHDYTSGTYYLCDECGPGQMTAADRHPARPL